MKSSMRFSRPTVLIALILVAALSQSKTVYAANVGAVVDVVLIPAGDFKAKTDDVKGTATLAGDTVKAENIIVPLKGLNSGIKLRDDHTKKKYLEIEKFPDAVLVKAEGKGGNGKGRIRIRNIEKDIAGTYKVEGSHLTAEFPLKLSDFGIVGIKYMGVGVDDNVKIHVTVPLKK